MLDEKGRVFGINIIDLIVIILFLCSFPVFYFWYKIWTKKSVITVKDNYIISKSCPNCGVGRKIEIKLEEPIPKSHINTCKNCGIEGEYIKQPKKIEVENYMQEYYKRLLEKG